ncbi:MAG: hypothetical protein Sapg2KO_33930 [Saprospiraceae bacterium]
MFNYVKEAPPKSGPMRKILYLLCFTPLLCFSQVQERSPLAAKGYLVILEENQGRAAIDPDFQVQKILSANYNIFHLSHQSGRTNKDLLNDLKHRPGIKHAQLNHPVLQRQTTPNDPFWEAQQNLFQIGISSLWQQSPSGKTTQGTPIVLGILEPDGFDTDHEDLQQQIWRNEREVPADQMDNDQNGYVDDYLGWNALQENDDHFSVNPHGTLVAGLASASTNNELGIASVGSNSKLLLLSGNRYESEVITNYLYALELRKRFNESQGKEGAFIVATNASFGISGDPKDFPIWCEIYDRLGEQGILNVSAADNRPVNTDLRADMPTSCNSDFLVTVTGVDEFDNFLTGQAFGPETVDIAAPASHILTTAPNNRYLEIPNAGTSYATPQVTGAIGLMYSLPYQQIQNEALASPDRTALLMKRFLLEGAQKLPTLKNKIRSQGRLDLQGTHQLMHQYFNQEPTELKIHQVYPNPFTSQIQIDCYLPTLGRYELKVLDTRGRLVTKQVLNNQDLGQRIIRLPLAQINAGVYLLQIESSTSVVTRKMVKIAR